jgi:Uncharacterised protein conserved in bacteria (DUF2336)
MTGDSDLLIARGMDAVDDLRRRRRLGAVDIGLPDRHRLPGRMRSAAIDAVGMTLGVLDASLVIEMQALGISGADAASPPGPHPALNAALAVEPLVTAAISRAGEHRFFEKRKCRDDDSLSALAYSADTETARRAVAFLVADGRRLGGLGGPVIVLDDLAPTTAEHLLWLAVASLRQRLGSSETGLDQMLHRAHASVMATHHPANATSALAMRLAARLHERGELSDRWIITTAEEGRLLVTAAAFAVRLGIDMGLAQALMLAAGDALALAGRAIGFTRSLNREFLEAMGHDDPERAAKAAKAAPGDMVDHVAARWRLAPGYLLAEADLRAADDR